MTWVTAEFEAIDLGDERLNRRAIHIMDTLGLAPGRTIPQVFQSWCEIKACYNFLSNDSVSDEKLLEPHMEKTIERIQEHTVVLLPSDTSEIDYSMKIAMAGKERLSNTKQGIWLHSTTAVTPDRLTLGIVETNFWHRNPEPIEDSSAARTNRDKAPIEEKESFRWLQSYRKACEIARRAPETQIIHMTDQEGDIVETFQEGAEQAKTGCYARFIIRSQHDRRIQDPDEKKLRNKLKNASSFGEIEFIVPATEKRSARKVKQQIKTATVTLIRKGIKVRVNAVMAIEIAPPEGEDSIVWILITDLPVDNFESAVLVLKYYLCRWEIETFFKVLKSGCKIEERQLHTTDRMKRLISLFMILGWRVMYTMMMGRVNADMSCADIFEEAEWKAVYKIVNRKKALPRTPPRLGDFVVMIATLGGYVVSKSGEPPGVKTMWRGMARMIDFTIAWEVFRG